MEGPALDWCRPSSPRMMRALVTRLVLLILLWLALPRTVFAHGEVPGVPTFPGVLLAWSFDPLPLVAIGVAAIAYLRAVRTVNAAHPRTPVPKTRTIAWLAGLGAVLLALQSPVDRYETALLSVHMVQHMLLQFVAAPLLLLGAPITLTLRVAGAPVRRQLLRVLHSRAVRVITHPIVAWSTFAAVNWFWQFSPAYNAALEVEVIHYLQHATFLAAGLLFWWPIAGIDPAPNKAPHPVRIGYLAMAIPQNSFFGITLMNSTIDLYPHYFTLARTWGPTLTEDFAMAGAIMWIGAGMMLVPAALLVVAAWMRDDERKTARREQRAGGVQRAELDREAWRASQAERAAKE